MPSPPHELMIGVLFPALRMPATNCGSSPNAVTNEITSAFSPATLLITLPIVLVERRERLPVDDLAAELWKRFANASETSRK